MRCLVVAYGSPTRCASFASACGMYHAAASVDVASDGEHAAHAQLETAKCSLMPASSPVAAALTRYTAATDAVIRS